MSTVEQLRNDFHKTFERPATAFFFAPGRVNLIGEYTDISGGHVFPCAVSLGTYAAAAPRSDRKIRLHSLNFQEKGVIEADLAAIERRPEHDWALYPLGVFRELAAHGSPVPAGADILYCGNLPNGTGLSSSASIEVLTATLLNDLFALGLDPVKLALISQAAENKFVGVACGIMDQFASAMGRSGQALLLNCRTLEYQYRPLVPDRASLVITNSHKRRSLNESKYNIRRAECEAALAAVRALKDVESLCDLTPAEFDPLSRAIKDPDQLKRARHVVGENQRTLEAAEALERGDLAAFGRLMKASHLSLRDDFEVSGRELDTLAELAWQCPGVIGSRMTGAGFGGCTVSFVEPGAVDYFRNVVGPAYEKAVGHPPSFYLVEAADGAAKLKEADT